MTTPVIRTSGLTRHFTRHKTTVEAVRGLDLEVAQGELVAFLGPNGAGKSTTLRMLTTLLPPTSGTAEVAGYDVVREHREVRRSIGYVGQGNAAGHAQRGRDELVSQARSFGMSRRQANERAEELLARLRPHRAGRRGRSRPCPVASAAGSTSRSGWCTRPGCCSSTSRRPVSTRRTGSTSRSRSSRLHARAGHHDRADHALPRGGGHDRRPGGRDRPRRGHRRRLGRAAQVVARRPGAASGFELGRRRDHRRRAGGVPPRRGRRRRRHPRVASASRTDATWPPAWSPTWPGRARRSAGSRSSDRPSTTCSST